MGNGDEKRRRNDEGTRRGGKSAAGHVLPCVCVCVCVMLGGRELKQSDVHAAEYKEQFLEMA